MVKPYLRLYDPDNEHESRQEPTVRVRLGDLFPLLVQAHRGNYLWLNDFQDDEIYVTPDLYEVLCAFQCYRPSA
ncbi:MAG: hypothetical protein C4297_13290 [Gemmataceae bacterium]